MGIIEDFRKGITGERYSKAVSTFLLLNILGIAALDKVDLFSQMFHHNLLLQTGLGIGLGSSTWIGGYIINGALERYTAIKLRYDTNHRRRGRKLIEEVIRDASKHLDD